MLLSWTLISPHWPFLLCHHRKGGGAIHFNIHEIKNNSDGRQRENLWPVLFVSLNAGGIHFCMRFNFYLFLSQISRMRSLTWFFFCFVFSFRNVPKIVVVHWVVGPRKEESYVRDRTCRPRGHEVHVILSYSWEQRAIGTSNNILVGSHIYHPCSHRMRTTESACQKSPATEKSDIIGTCQPGYNFV